MTIHPSAFIDQKVNMGKNNRIGPNVIIEGPVTLGENNIIDAGAIIKGNTLLGNGNHIHSYAYIGNEPQDLTYKGGDTRTVIGDNNIFREFSTIHRGSCEDTETRIGNNNYMMVSSHIAHDCRLGNHNIIVNCTALAGHAELGDHVFISAFVGVHQHTRIGSYVMVGAVSKVVQDVPPYLIIDGRPTAVHGLNLVGLKRNGFTPDRRAFLKKAFNQIYKSGVSLKTSIVELEKLKNSAESDEQSADIQLLIEFLHGSKRGILFRSATNSLKKNTDRV
jgi:UDP-N-acetylglucosamine acyltransferase